MVHTADSLYVMRNSIIPGMVKIGRSHFPEERAKDLAAAHPFEIIVRLSYKGWGRLEKEMHEKLRHRRVDGGSGREWYQATPEKADLLINAVILEHELIASISECNKE